MYDLVRKRIFQSYLCSPLVVHTVTYKRKYRTRYTMLQHLLTQLTGCKAGAWGRYRGYRCICPLAQSLGYCRCPQSCLHGFAKVSSEGQPLPAKARPRTKAGLKVPLFHQDNEPPSRNTYMCEIRLFSDKIRQACGEFFLSSPLALQAEGEQWGNVQWT